MCRGKGGWCVSGRNPVAFDQPTRRGLNLTGLSTLGLQLRLNPQQLEEKKAAEAAVSEVTELIEAEEDAAKKADLQVELKARQDALDELMDGFEVRCQ